MLQRGVVLLMLSVLVNACATTARRASDAGIAVASDAVLALLPAQDMLQNVTLTQRIDASYEHAGKPAQTRSFIVQVEAGANDIRMAGLTPMGVQLFAVTLQGTALAVDVPPYLSLPFDPRFMLADMQLALADVALLNAHLDGGQLRELEGGRRELIASDVVRLRIDYRGKHGGNFCEQGGETRIEHLQRRYRIHITTLSCDRS